MTDARDELANLIRDTVHAGTRRVNWGDIADAIIAAGWVKPGPTVVDIGYEFGSDLIVDTTEQDQVVRDYLNRVRATNPQSHPASRDREGRTRP